MGKYRKVPIYLLISIWVLPFLSCNSSTGPDTEPDQAKVDSGTVKMVNLLAKIAEEARPAKNIYLNARRIEYYKHLQSLGIEEKEIIFEYNAARERLYAGDTKKAIEELIDIEKRLEVDSIHPVFDKLRMTRELIALGYLRQGEQDNCILNHSTESCVVPITGDGIHVDQTGSRNAIRKYLQLLEEYPDELNHYVWLLNIAYMTIGIYPDSVPQKYLIREEAFDSDVEIDKFKDIAPKLGLDVTGLSGGSILEDFNNDGHLDIMASEWLLTNQLRYFQNNANGTFTEMTVEAGLTGITGGINIVQADYDNDGYIDVFIMRGAWLGKDGEYPNSLLRNNGDGTFSDVTETAGLLSFRPTPTAAWGDYNNDGWLDLFIGNESSPQNQYFSQLYRNNRDGTFTEVAREAGIDVKKFVKGVAWGDYDNDGKLDLYISGFFSNILMQNMGPDDNGMWIFRDMSHIAGVSEPSQSFPTWFWDYNNDGWEDIFVCGYGIDGPRTLAGEVAAEYRGMPIEGEIPRLYRNNGNGTFSNVTIEAGLNTSLFAMGCNYGDLDNDGFLDMYIGTGEPDFSSIIPNRVFRNADGKFFQDVTTSGGFGHLQKGHGVSFGDIDHDGDQDIYTVIGGAYEGDVFQNVLYENPGTENHWITIFLEGVESNKYGVGSRIKISVTTPEGPRDIYSTVSTGGSFGANSLRQEIGLGNATTIDRINITWHGSGNKQSFRSVGIDQHIKIVEGNDDVQKVELKTVDLRAKSKEKAHIHNH